MKMQRYDVDWDGTLKADTCGDYVKYSDLQELIDAAPVVWGCGDRTWRTWHQFQASIDTHKAVLMFIEELKQEPCKHEPEVLSCMDAYAYSSKCKYCKIELIADWRPKGGGDV